MSPSTKNPSVTRTAFWAGVCTTTFSFLLASAAWPDTDKNGRTVTIAQVGSTLLNSELTLGTGFSGVTINDAGQVEFSSRVQGADSPSDNGIFIGSSEGLSLVALRNQEMPNGGTLASITSRRGLNNDGDVAFLADIDSATPDDRGVFVGSGDGLSQYARVGQQLPGDGGGTLTGGNRFSGLRFNNSGHAIFIAGISNEGTGRRGIFRATDMGLTELVREGSEIPHGDGIVHWSDLEWGPSSGPRFSFNETGQVQFNAPVNELGGPNYRASFISTNGTLSLVSSPNDPLLIGNGERIHLASFTVINDAGGLTFRSAIYDVNGDPIGDSGYYHYQAGQLTELVREGDIVPGGGGTINSLPTLSSIVNTHINNVGQIAFRPSGFGGPNGVYRASPDGLVQIAHVGDSVADDATISGFGADTIVGITDSGTIAYRVVLDVDGFPFGREAIFFSDGIDTVRVAQQGIEVNSLNFTSNQVARLNKHGEVAYRANGVGSSNTQIVNLFTPDLHYRVSDDGSFDDGTNWTLSLTPGEPHDVKFAPDSDVTVTSDSGSRSVNSLQVGGGSGQAALHLAQNSVINVAEQVTVKAGGTLGGEGSITGDVINAEGLVSPGSSPGILSIAGNYTQGEDASLLIEIGGLNAGTDYDVLDIGDHAQLGGELILRFIDGFAPSEGDVFNFMLVLGDTIGAFEEVTIENLLPDFEYSIAEIATGSLVALNDGTFIIAGELEVSATKLDFGKVTPGDTATLELTLTNGADTDAEDLILTTLAIEDGAFAVTDAGDCEVGMTLPPTASCSVKVSFAPDQIGEATGQLTVAANSQTINIELVGRGFASDTLELTPSELNYGEVMIGQSATEELTLENTDAPGSASVMVGDIRMSGSEDFSVIDGSCQTAVTELKPAETCTISVRFTPSGKGSVGAFLLIDGSDGKTAASQLSGSGIAGKDQIFNDRFQSLDD